MTLVNLIVALLLTWAIGVAYAQELEKVVIGHYSISNDISFNWVPQQKGLFKKKILIPPSYLFPEEFG